MTKNRFGVSSLFVGVLALSACTQDESRDWMKFQQSRKEAALSRRPAQNDPKCFADYADPAWVRSEIGDLEKRYPGQKKGTYAFGGQSFSDLNASTIDFLGRKNFLLKEHGTSWIASSPAQAGCGSDKNPAACFIQSLYVGKNGEALGKNEGLLNYWFFLKTGVVLAAKNAYPWYQAPLVVSVSPKDIPLQDFLFDAEEMTAWWKMANLLPASMLHMPSLQTVHRTPRGNPPEEWKKSMVCGLSSGWWSGGTILLEDGCLILGKKNPQDTRASYFYPATTHEFAHRLAAWNFNKGKTKTGPDLDEAPDFLALSSWVKAQLVDVHGKAYLEWQSNPKAQFISTYAQTDPSEDFAEAVGYYRTNPTWAKEKAPLKYEFLKKRVFGDRGYTPDELKTQYTEQAVHRVIENMDEWLKECLVEKPLVPAVSTSGYSRFPAAVQLTVAVGDAAKSCMQVQVVNEIAKAMAEVRRTEPEGCDYLGKFESYVVEATVQLIGAKISPLLKGDAKVAERMKNVQAFRSALKEEYDARVDIVSCWRNETPKACYESKMQKAFEQFAQKNRGLLIGVDDDSLAIEEQRAKRVYAYDVKMIEVAEFYEKLMAGEVGKVTDRAEALWNDCARRTGSADLKEVKLVPYSPGAYFIPPVVLDCMNRSLEDEFASLRRTAGADQDLVIIASEAREWVDQKILLPRFKVVFDQRVDAAKKETQTRFVAAAAGIVDEVSAAMTKDFASWQPDGVYFNYANCKRGATVHLNRKFPEEQYRFIALGAELDSYGNKICERVRGWVTQTANQATEKSSTNAFSEVRAVLIERTPDALWQKLSGQALETAKSRFEHCRKKVYFTQRLRRYCLFTETVLDDQDQIKKNAWAWTRDRAIRAWMKAPEVAKYVASKAYSEGAFFEAVRTRIDDESEPVVDQIVDSFFDQ